MAEVTYYVALPFVAADDGIAADEPAECFNPNAAVIAPRRYRARKVSRCRRIQPHWRSRYGRFQRCQGDQKVRRRAG
jgi:hypothetical protein